VELRRGRGAIVWTEDGLDVSFGVVERDTGVMGPHGWVLHRHEEGFALDVPDGTRRIFAPDLDDPARWRFRLAAVEDRAGNRIQLHYRGASLSRIIDCVGRTIRVLTTREGRIAALEIVCPSGRVVRAVTYEHDPAGNLAKVTDADGHATTYAYDDDHRLVSYRLPTGLVYTRIVDNSIRPPTVLYDGYNVKEAGNKDPEHGGQIPQQFTNKPCAETQALQRMKNEIIAEVEAEQKARWSGPARLRRRDTRLASRGQRFAPRSAAVDPGSCLRAARELRRSAAPRRRGSGGHRLVRHTRRSPRSPDRAL
jgi:YD repeat-containing protein